MTDLVIDLIRELLSQVFGEENGAISACDENFRNEISWFSYYGIRDCLEVNKCNEGIDEGAHH